MQTHSGGTLAKELKAGEVIKSRHWLHRGIHQKMSIGDIEFIGGLKNFAWRRRIILHFIPRGPPPVYVIILAFQQVKVN
jgi:hypothetical protein